MRIRPITALHVLERILHVMTNGRLLNPLVASLMGGGNGGSAAEPAPPPRLFAGGLASGVLTSPFARSEYPSLWVCRPLSWAIYLAPRRSHLSLGMC